MKGRKRPRTEGVCERINGGEAQNVQRANLYQRPVCFRLCHCRPARWAGNPATGRAYSGQAGLQSRNQRTLVLGKHRPSCGIPPLGSRKKDGGIGRRKIPRKGGVANRGGLLPTRRGRDPLKCRQVPQVQRAASGRQRSPVVTGRGPSSVSDRGRDFDTDLGLLRKIFRPLKFSCHRIGVRPICGPRCVRNHRLESPCHEKGRTGWSALRLAGEREHD